ncbi:MAG TPA: hypothetical protein VHS09_14350, partial [Polyangiaceae bacterium]|nr:hypothetical protein [Polyangiaceae bacterium]
PSKPPRRAAKTLRSFEAPADPLDEPPHEKTLRLAGAPPHPVLAPASRTTARLPMAPAASAGVAPPSTPSLPGPPPAAWRPPPVVPAHRPAPRANVAVYVVLVAVVGLILCAVGAWLVFRLR